MKLWRSFDEIMILLKGQVSADLLLMNSLVCGGATCRYKFGQHLGS